MVATATLKPFIASYYDTNDFNFVTAVLFMSTDLTTAWDDAHALKMTPEWAERFGPPHMVYFTIEKMHKTHFFLDQMGN